MISDLKGESGPQIRLVSAARRIKTRQNRMLNSALRPGEGPDREAAAKLADRFFQGTPSEDKRPQQFSLLITLIITMISFYVIWPSFMKRFDVQKLEQEIYVPGGGAASLRAVTQKQERKRVVRQEMVPQMFPKIKDVTITLDDDPEFDLDQDFDNLSVGDSFGDMDTGFGDGYGGPVLNAGTGDVPEPVLIHRVEPDYPDAGRRARVDGFVLIEAIINTRGDVVNIKVLQAPPAKYGFAEKAREAVEQWKFKPAIYKGRAVNVRIRFQVEFSLIYY
ncbi:MAG TPA: energy transducer TonB [Acidobacteriota bacterium]|nr:energy transducer TonB [Acidobacteriota bacterium]